MSSKPDNVESTQKSEPWKEQKPYIIQGLQDAASLYAQGAPDFFPGSTYAGLRPVQQQAIGGIVNAARGPYLQQAANTFGDIAQGGGATQQALGAYQQAAAHGGIGGAGGLNTLRQASRGDLIGKNPYLDAIYNRGAGDIQSRISGAASAAGRYGSGAMGHQLASDLGDFNNQLYGSQYNAERSNQLNAAQTLQQQAFQGLAGSAALGQQQTSNQLAAAQGLGNVDAQRIANQQQALQAGSLNQQDAQNQLNANIQRYNYEANAPMNWLQQYMGTVGAGYGGGTSTTQTPYYQPSPFSQILGAGTGLLGLFG